LEVKFKASAVVAGRYWKFAVVNNHGNSAYRWFCEIDFYTDTPQVVASKEIQV